MTKLLHEYHADWNEMSLASWLLHHQRNIHFKQRYWGLEFQKNPFDLIVYAEIIEEIRPNTIIEIGAAGGGSALWLCHQLDLINQGQLLSVDINHGGFKAQHPRIFKVTGPSQDYQIALEVKQRCRGVTLVIHDGSHKKCDIKKDFELYGPLVSVGSYFIIEDGIMDVLDWKDHRTAGHDCGLVAGLEIAEENDDFEIDYSRERFIMTYNPGGYLKCIK